MTVETPQLGKRWRRLAGAAALIVGLCAVALCVWWGGWLWEVRSGSVSQRSVLGDPQFRFFAYVAAGSLIAAAGLVAALLRAGRRFCQQTGRRPGSEDGTAMVEFALVLPIAMVIVLLTVQSSMLMGAYLCVNYSSYCAARAAVTIVPAELGDEGPNVVADESDTAGSEKIWRIHQAAVWAVMPIGNGAHERISPYADVLVDGLESLLGQYDLSSWTALRERLGRKLAYAAQNTTVRLTPPTDGSQYGEHEDLTVTVRHNLYLSVPYASSLLAWLDSEHSVKVAPGRYAVWVEIPCTLTNEGISDRIELEPPASP